MDTIVSQVTAAIIKEPSPVPVESFLVKWSQWCRSQPHVVIDSSGWTGVLWFSNGTLACTFPGLGNQHLSEFPGTDVIDCLLEMITCPGLRSHLDNALVLSHGCHHPFSLFHVVAIWLFHVNILSCKAGEDRGDGMPVVRGANNKYIDGGVIHQSAEIPVGSW